jgi:hypothetical protein
MSATPVPALLRQQVDRWADTWLTAKFSRLLDLRAQDPGRFNYPIAVFSERRGKAIYLIAKHAPFSEHRVSVWRGGCSPLVAAGPRITYPNHDARSRRQTIAIRAQPRTCRMRPIKTGANRKSRTSRTVYACCRCSINTPARATRIGRRPGGAYECRPGLRAAGSGAPAG